MKTILISLFCWLAVAGHAQNITGAEYFIDTDPGAGNGIAINTGAAAADVSFTASINTAGLAAGFHFAGIRMREGIRWGLTELRGFYVSATAVNAGDITAAEYFIDTDPGAGAATPIAVSPGQQVAFTVSVPTASLATGFHFLAIRTRDADGKWGLFEARGFYISPVAAGAAVVVAAEYFIDSDPGVGAATALPVGSSGTNVSFTASIPTASLAPGFHFLSIRTRDADGRWGLMENRGFYISPTASNMANAVAGEFFLDSDPGVGNGLPFSFATPGQTVNEIVQVQIPPGTAPGPHLLVARVRDAAGHWSLFDTVRRLNVTMVSLPLDFLSFSGRRAEAKVALQWVTENERGTAHFDVERSRNGLEFTRIGQVASRNTSGRQTYAFDDLQPFKGVNFYRLKQVDQNGAFKYSVIIRVFFGDAGMNELKLFPQPVQTNLNVVFGGNGNNLMIQVYDAGGKLVLGERKQAVNTFTLETSALARGSYWIVVSDGLTQQKGQFVKQ